MRRTRIVTHIIYHIPGRKVGCTKSLESRKSLYLRDDGAIPENIQVLQKLYNASDQEAGDIEWEWADKLGMRRGMHYTKCIANLKKHAFAGGKVGGRRIAELGLSGFKQQTFEERSKRSSRTATKMALEKNTPAFKMVKCPHCGTESNKMIMSRWHFDKCWILSLKRGYWVQGLNSNRKI